MAAQKKRLTPKHIEAAIRDLLQDLGEDVTVFKRRGKLIAWVPYPEGHPKHETHFQEGVEVTVRKYW